MLCEVFNCLICIEVVLVAEQGNQLRLVRSCNVEHVTPTELIRSMSLGQAHLAHLEAINRFERIDQTSGRYLRVPVLSVISYCFQQVLQKLAVASTAYELA